MINRREEGDGLIGLTLVTLIVLTYGVPLLFGWFGFYGDDWIYIYNQRLAGAKSFVEFVRWDRPFSAWVYVLSGAAFGTSPILYHVLILAQRVFAAILFFATFRILFPKRRLAVAAASFLFALYPGFKQQPIAVQFILHFASMDLCLLSMWWMVRVAVGRVNGPRAAVGTVFMALLAALGLFSCEYFTGWELLRPALIWVALSGHGSENLSSMRRLTAVIRAWFPYLLGTAGFLIWRVFIFSFQTYQPKLLNELNDSPAQGLATMTRRVLSDLNVVTIETFRNTFKQPSGLGRRLIFGGVILVSFTVLTIVFRSIPSSVSDTADDSQGERRDLGWLVVLGCLALLTAGVPFWATLLPIETSFPWDRSTLPFGFGVALLFAGLVGAFFRRGAAPFVFAFLVALSAGSHAVNAMIYHDETAKLNDYFWQLSWRAPAIQSGTTVVSADIPLDRTSDNDLTPILNWQYAPNLRGFAYDYKYFDLHLRYRDYFVEMAEGEPFQHDYRSHRFAGNTGQILALTYKVGGCLWVLSGRDAAFPGLGADLASLIPRSDFQWIQLETASPAIPPAAIGAEPEHGYCYAFQQLRKAEQADNLGSAREIVTQVEAEGLAAQAHDPFDLIPLVSAAAALGEDGLAREYADRVLAHDGNRGFLCSYLKRAIYSGESAETRGELSAAIGCDD